MLRRSFIGHAGTWTAIARPDVIVDQPDGLHERVADRRSDEREAARLQVTAERIGLSRAREKTIRSISDVRDAT